MLDLSSLLSTSRDVSAVPVLDEAAFRLGTYRDGSVLKFRGVVRDVQDPELVLLGDEAPALTVGDAVRQQLVERVPLTVTLFPHVSDWSTRAFRDVSVVDKSIQSDGRCSVSERPLTSKRSSVAMDEQTNDVCGQDQDESHVKKSKAVVQQQQGEEALLVPQAVNIYVYDGQYEDTPLDAFKVNEAFEFVGILDLMVPGTATKKDDTETVLSAKQLEELQISDCIDEVQRTGRSGVVLHCCRANSLQSVHHVRPHESREFYEQIHESNDSRTKFCRDEWSKLGQEADIAAVRLQIVQYLAQTVRGDTLAAEYLLLGLLSHVYSRADPSTPLGNLSINLALDNASGSVTEGAQLDQVYAHKDYEREMLLSGVLQVANGTTMLVNETVLSAGQLNDQGVKNIAALQSLVDKMLLPYDFHFYNMDFPQDVAVVTVSEGKSILPVTVAVPVVADSNVTEELPEEQVLECFRLFLCVLRSFVVTIGNEEAEMAEKHYVECRKSEQKVALEDLHRWLRLARLVALSRGEGQISKDSWDAMLALETHRLARLPATTPGLHELPGD
ncbi:Mini-chromosome maintenance complex-binding protein [Phytophthora cactorum]|nr:Mini-chromosome maintenance complex-binding protein [Phytophthora cactorum]